MDAMVTARVPVEVKKQGDAILRELGSSATELVNTAYEYVLKNRALPGLDAKTPAPSGKLRKKVLKGKAAKDFSARWTALHALPVPEYDGSNFGDLLENALKERYESIPRQ